MKVQRSIEIAAPPQKVWPFLVEPEKMLKWCHTVQKCEATGERRGGIGATLYMEEKAAGSLMKLNFAVTEWVENQKVTYMMTSGNFVKGYEQKYTLEAIPAGSRFVFMEEIQLPYGVIGKAMGLVGRGSSEKHVKDMLDTLKSLAEA